MRVTLGAARRPSARPPPFPRSTRLSLSNPCGPLHLPPRAAFQAPLARPPWCPLTSALPPARSPELPDNSWPGRASCLRVDRRPHACTPKQFLPRPPRCHRFRCATLSRMRTNRTAKPVFPLVSLLGGLRRRGSLLRRRTVTTAREARAHWPPLAGRAHV